MKSAIFLTLALLANVSMAKTFICSSEVVGVIQFDFNGAEVKACVFKQNAKKGWDKVESGVSTESHKYFNNQDYTNHTSINFITEKRDFQIDLPNDFKDQSKIGLNWSSDSSFGPYINSGTASGTSAICFEKENVNPCDAKLFQNPKNTPKDFRMLKIILDENAKDLWGDYPTFTLVSPDLNDFVVFNKFLNGSATITYSSGGSTGYSEKELFKDEILPKLKAKWTLVPVYSNEIGVKYFNQLNK